MTVPDHVAATLRDRILSGALGAGERLREVQLAEEFGAARHTVRAALRALAAERLIALEPNRGAHVRLLDATEIVGLYELRTALELEAAQLALHRHGGRLPDAVHQAARQLAAECRRQDPSWASVMEAHAEVHGAIVRAARSPRIEQTHRSLEPETRLFLLRIKPLWTWERMATDHLELIQDLEREGPEPLRAHLRASAAALVDEL